MPRTIRQTFSEWRSSRRFAVAPFIPAGYPDLATTQAALKACDRAGAAIIEVGFPFSDPVADGPVIQEAFTYALSKKLKVQQIFAAIGELKGQIQTPLVAMASYSIIFRYGLDRFLSDAKGAEFGGLIIPDLPPPEAESVCGKVREAGLETTLLIAPTTAAARRQEIARLSSGFVYYLSISGTTGERDALPPELAAGVAQIKTMTDTPICVGFGIHRRSQLDEMAGFADGAIVGSAIVRRMKEHMNEKPEAIAAIVEGYVRELTGN